MFEEEVWTVPVHLYFEKSCSEIHRAIKVWYYVKGKKGRGGSRCCQIGIKGVPQVHRLNGEKEWHGGGTEAAVAACEAWIEEHLDHEGTPIKEPAPSVRNKNEKK